MPKSTQTEIERFIDKIVESPTHSHDGTPCFEWTGGTITGYGSFWDQKNKRHILAHRFAYEYSIGPIPPGLHLDHLCRVTNCVNPLHLEPVTKEENSRRVFTSKVTAKGCTYRKLSASDRFHRKHSRGASITYGVTPCWNWVGCLDGHGYGMLRNDDGKYVKAHRWSYEYHTGPIPKGLHIDHLCRNRACVNPAHLEAVTNRINSLRGISPPSRNAKKKKCPSGHPYSGDNLYVKPNGHRECRACKLVNYRAWKLEHAASNREYMREWRASHPEHIEQYQQKDNARKRSARKASKEPHAS